MTIRTYGPAHRWFAWRPVDTDDRGWVWLRAARRIGDLDKLCRSTLDALSDVIYRDDCQVVDIRATKRVALPGETPGAHITIEGITA